MARLPGGHDIAEVFGGDGDDLEPEAELVLEVEELLLLVRE